MAAVVLTTSLLNAQVSYRGVSTRGTSNDNRTALKQQGLVAEFQADQNIVLNGTNVESWGDITGNNFQFNQYTSGRQPSFVASYNTNGFPAIVFDNTTTQRLINYPLASLYTGNKPFTMIFLCCGTTNSNNSIMFGMGWTGATNSNASELGVRPNGTTVTTLGAIFGSDTNSSATTISIAGSLNTNIYRYITISWDTNNFVLMNNLTSTTTSVPNGNRTQDTCSFGGIFRAANAFGLTWSGGVTGGWLFTNAINGSPGIPITNVLNSLNTKFKVY